MFKISDYTGTTFWAILKDENGNILAEHEVMDLTIHRWNEIGLMVTAQVAQKIKNPDKPTELIADRETQARYDAEAELKRNAMRLVECLEGGGGIDWGEDDPQTLQEKAELLQQSISQHIFLGFLTILQNRVYRTRITAEDAKARFQRIQAEAESNSEQQTDDPEPVAESA